MERKRGADGKFLRKYVDTPDWGLDARYNREWRKRHDLCENCAKKPRVEGLSRCADCALPLQSLDNGRLVDYVEVYEKKPRSYARMKRARKARK